MAQVKQIPALTSNSALQGTPRLREENPQSASECTPVHQTSPAPDPRLQPGGDLVPGTKYARDFDADKGMPWALRNGAVRASRFSLQPFGLASMRVASIHIVGGRLYVQVEVETRHRDTGDLTHIAFVRDVDRGTAQLSEDDFEDLGASELRRLVWQACMLTLAHELDECLKMDGARLREAHPGDPFPSYDFRRMDAAPVSVAEVAELRERVAFLEARLAEHQRELARVDAKVP
jgi:hypothetical protein